MFRSSKKSWNILFEIFLVIFAIYGVYSTTAFQISSFMYYTILSNILCLIFFSFNIYYLKRGKESNYHVKGGVTLAITITMLIYWFVLAPHGFIMNLTFQFFGNLCVHLIVPLMVIFDWLIFDKKGMFSRIDPIRWLIIPLSYYIFTLIAASLGVVYPLGGHYPYFFINPVVIGIPAVIRNVILLLFFFLGLGYLLYATDKKLSRKKNLVN